MPTIGRKEFREAQLPCENCALASTGYLPTNASGSRLERALSGQVGCGSRMVSFAAAMACANPQAPNPMLAETEQAILIALSQTPPDTC